MQIVIRLNTINWEYSNTNDQTTFWLLYLSEYFFVCIFEIRYGLTED